MLSSRLTDRQSFFTPKFIAETAAQAFLVGALLKIDEAIHHIGKRARALNKALCREGNGHEVIGAVEETERYIPTPK